MTRSELPLADLDRVADLWGARTPHSKGSVWPARQDLRLEDGLQIDDVDHWVGSACVLCSNGCGCDIAVKDGRMVGVRGRLTTRSTTADWAPRGCTARLPGPAARTG